MFVNEEILKKFDPCESGLRFMRRFYPDGIEIIDLLDNPHVPIDILHWGAEKLPVSNEELQKYYKACGVKNSKEVYSSKNVVDSSWIYKSEEVYTSNYVNCSKEVVRSDNIRESRQIFDSKEVFNSDNVLKSENVSFGINIVDSFYILNSIDISSSSMIKEGSSLDECYLSWKIKDCKEVFFSSFIENCKHLLFCSNLMDKRFQCFNNPIDKMDFYNIKRELLKMLNEERKNFSKLFNYSKPTSIFKMSKKFCEWVKTLPGYDPFIMYQITFDRDWLD